MAKRIQKNVQLVTMCSLLREEAYEAAIKLGISGLKPLKTIAAGADFALAIKAVHVAGAIGLGEAATIVAAAARSRKQSLKTAAAAAARLLPAEMAEPILQQLLKSRDLSVRKWAIRSVEGLASEKLCAVLDHLRSHDSNEYIRKVAHTTRTNALRRLDKTGATRKGRVQ